MKFFLIAGDSFLVYASGRSNETTNDPLEARIYSGDVSAKVMADRPGIGRTPAAPILMDVLNRALKRADKAREMLVINDED